MTARAPPALPSIGPGRAPGPSVCGPATPVGSSRARKPSELPGRSASMPQTCPPQTFPAAPPPPRRPRPRRGARRLTWGPARPGVRGVGAHRGRQDREPLRSIIAPARGSLQVRGPRQRGRPASTRVPAARPAQAGRAGGGCAPLPLLVCAHIPARDCFLSSDKKKKKKWGERARERSAPRTAGFEGGALPGAPPPPVPRKPPWGSSWCGSRRSFPAPGALRAACSVPGAGAADRGVGVSLEVGPRDRGVAEAPALRRLGGVEAVRGPLLVSAGSPARQPQARPGCAPGGGPPRALWDSPTAELASPEKHAFN